MDMTIPNKGDSTLKSSPGHEYDLTGESLIIFNELYAGREVNVLAGTLAFSIRPLVQLGVQTFQIRKKGRKRPIRSPILAWHQVANWVRFLKLDRSTECSKTLK